MSGVDFFKKSVMLWIGNILLTILNIIGFYLLTNFLSPGDYGNYSLVLSIAAFLSLAFYGIITDAIVRFSIEGDSMFYYGLKLNIICGLLIFLFMFIFSEFIAHIYDKPISLIIKIVAFVFLFTAIIEAIKAYAIGKKKVNNFTYISTLAQVINIIVLLIFFKISRNVVIAAIAYLLSNIFTLFAILKQFKFKKIFTKKKKELTKRMNRYIKDGFLFGITKNIFFQSPLIIGAYFIDSVSLAFYSFGLSIGINGLFTFITSIQTMLLPYIVNLKDEKQISKYISVVIKAGIVVSFILSIFVLIAVYLLLPIFFPKYVPTFKYIPWILLSFILLNLRAPMTLFKVIERMDALTKISVISAVSSIIFGIVLGYFFGLIGMIITLNINVLFSSYLHIHYLNKLSTIKISLLPNSSDWLILKKYSNFVLKGIKHKYFK